MPRTIPYILHIHTYYQLRHRKILIKVSVLMQADPDTDSHTALQVRDELARLGKEGEGAILESSDIELLADPNYRLYCQSPKEKVSQYISFCGS